MRPGSAALRRTTSDEMTVPIKGDPSREAIDALGGYVYQLYQSALSWTDLSAGDLLLLEVAEDYATVVDGVLTAVQVKRTSGTITINTDGVVAAIDSFFDLIAKNPSHMVHLRYQTTSTIGTEQKVADRVSCQSTLEAWRALARSGDLSELRDVLSNSKLSPTTKATIAGMGDDEFRTHVLRRIHFDCGEPDVDLLRRELRAKLLSALEPYGGRASNMEQCETAVLFHLMHLSSAAGARTLDWTDLQGIYEKSTRASMSLAEFDRQNRLLSDALESILPRSTGGQIANIQQFEPLPSLPEIYSPRSALLGTATSILSRNGILWLHGSTGLGKTTFARILANSAGGGWSGLGLRGFDSRQTQQALKIITGLLPRNKPTGLVIDDLEVGAGNDTVDALQGLLSLALRLDVPIVVTSSVPAPSRVAFTLGTPDEVSFRVPDLAEGEVGELISAHGGSPGLWARYVYLVSGGGHPQLVEALIRNIRKRGWPVRELHEVEALFHGNVAMDQVRAETRQRLLEELPSTSLTLLQRLSLLPGSFDRGLVGAVAQVQPIVPHGAIIAEGLVGPWIDQPDSKHFQLSPLLSDLGKQSLSDAEQKIVYSTVADHLTTKSIDVQNVNTAALAALLSRNEFAMFRIQFAVQGASEEELEIIAGYLVSFSYFRTETSIWPDNPMLGLMMRGNQILLARARNDLGEMPALLTALEREAEAVGSSDATALYEVYLLVRLLTKWSRDGVALPGFYQAILRLHHLLPIAEQALARHGEDTQSFARPGGISVVGFAFLVQVQGLKAIDDLQETFAFLDRCTPELRNEALEAFGHAEFEIDMLLRQPWLVEHAAGSIRPDHHAEVFETLEQMAHKWGRNDLAVACCKFGAVIRDEYGGDKAGALDLIDRGLRLYGEDNTELRRAKAKVYFRAKDYLDSLTLGHALIRENAIGSAVERAFLGRDTAICAENLSDFVVARECYLYGHRAADESPVEDMLPMGIGLLADAALAAWHATDRPTCLREFIEVLRRIATLDPASSLRNAHCRAVAQHVILWLDEQASGKSIKLEDGKEPQIYPGCVSNPEPHPDIKNRLVSPIEYAWYMLAKVECASGLDIGLASSLDTYLPRGRIIEGEAILSVSLAKRALKTLKMAHFDEGIVASIAAHYSAGSTLKMGKAGYEVTYGTLTFPPPDEQERFQVLADYHVLTFASACVFRGNVDAFESLEQRLDSQPVAIGNDVRSGLREGSASDTFNGTFARLLGREHASSKSGAGGDPTECWLLMSSAIQCAPLIGVHRTLAELGLEWFERKWRSMIVDQRFRLVAPSLNCPAIEFALDHPKDRPASTLFDLLRATLPATKLGRQPEALGSLAELELRY